MEGKDLRIAALEAQLSDATEREANVPALVDRLLATSASDSTRLPAEAPYFGPMALKHVEGTKGRGHHMRQNSDYYGSA